MSPKNKRTTPFPMCACGKGRAIYKSEFCENCYQQWRRVGWKTKRCRAVDENGPCTKPSRTNELCMKHDMRMRRLGKVSLNPRKPVLQNVTGTVAAYEVAAALELLAPGERLANFVRAALVNEVARRRALKREARPPMFTPAQERIIRQCENATDEGGED